MSDGTIYVSHIEDATSRVATLMSQLGDASLTVWSRRTTPKGTSWRRRISSCDLFLACCVSGTHARDEVELARQATRTLVVVLLDESPVPAELLGFFTVAAYANPVRAVGQIRYLFHSGEQPQARVETEGTVAGNSVNIDQCGGGETIFRAKKDFLDTKWDIKQRSRS